MTETNSRHDARVALFQKRAIRRTLHEDEWWFVITDIIAALTDSANPSEYWKKMRNRDPALLATPEGGGQFVPPLRSCSKLRAVLRRCNAGTLRVSSG